MSICTRRRALLSLSPQSQPPTPFYSSSSQLCQLQGKKRTGAQPTYPGPACSRQVCEKASSEAVGTIRDDVSGGLRDATGHCRQTRMGRSRDAGLQRRLRGFVAWAYPAGLRHGLPHLQPEYEGKALK